MPRPRHAMLLGLLAAALAVAGCGVPTPDPTPVVGGDSLTVQADAAGALPGVIDLAELGSDPCTDTAAIVAAGQHSPNRIVLAYTGNAHSIQLADAMRIYGPFGVGQLYANCVRTIRAKIPVTVPIVVTAAVACTTVPGRVNGSPTINSYVATAVRGGRYLSGATVGPLPDTTYSTALLDRLTPGGVYRAGDSGGVLRAAADGLHLTPYGGQVYGTVLVGLAHGTIR